jgi:hypothetical protein
VQHKITNFGKDIAKMALGFAGPLALVQMGFQKINDMMEEQKRKREELSASIQADPLYQEIVKQKEYASSLSETERVILALIEAKKKQIEINEKDKTAREEYTRSFLETNPKGKAIVESTRFNMSGIGPGQTMSTDVLSKIPKYQDIAQKELKIEADKIAKQLEFERNRAANDAQLEIIRQRELAEDKIKETFRQKELSDQQKLLFNLVQQQSISKNLIDLEQKKKAIITVSSLREMGGGIYGESAALKNQNQSQENSPMVTALNAQLDGLRAMEVRAREQIDALTKNTNAIEGLQFKMPESTFNGQSPLNNNP